MDENIPEPVRISFIKWGDERVFGDDLECRTGLSDRECIQRFTKLWRESIAHAVSVAPLVTLEKAKEILQDEFNQLDVYGFHFRRFSLNDVSFLCRITSSGVCDRLWELDIF